MIRDVEKKPLLVNEDRSVQKSVKNSDNLQLFIRGLLIMLYIMLLQVGNINQTLYIYHRVAGHSKGGNATDGFSNHTTDLCGNNETMATEHKDQSQAATWTWYFSLIDYGLATPVMLVLGLYSDYIGRKPLLLISLLGGCIRFGIMTIIINQNFDLKYLIVFYFISGITGSEFTFFMALAASISDKTQYDKSRTMGLALLELLIGAGSAVAKLGIGYLIKFSGFMTPTIICSVTFLFCFFLAWYGIQDTIERNPSKVPTCISMRKIFGFFFDKSSIIDNKQRTFITVWLSFLVMYFARSTGYDLEIIYDKRYPLCWTSEEIGWYGFVTNMIQFIGGIMLLKLLQKYLSDENMSILGCVSNIGFFVIMGLATTNWMMYISVVCGLLSIIPIPVMKAVLSRLVQADKQGVLFANLYVLQSVSHLTGGSIFKNLYSETADTRPGLSFLIVASIFIVPIILLTSLRIQCRPRVTKVP